MKIQFYIYMCVVLVIYSLSSCSKPIPTSKDLAKENIIPKPLELKATHSSFKITSETAIVLGDDSEEMKKISNYFADLLKPATGFNFPQNHNLSDSLGNINFKLVNIPELGNEGYLLIIKSDIITLKANKAEGIFRGIQTIRQLFPPIIEKNTVQNVSWEIASGTIKDYPDFAYRGSMLDVACHFSTVDEVKEYIDWMTRYKMNVFHIHLTDDQGWRIEIKKWPKLTEIGGVTEIGGKKSSFYTQEDYKEIISYAMDRYIEVIPEIDIPGHTNAALAAYPELNCDNKARDLYFGSEVGFSTLCTRKEITYQFITDVVAEIAALSPSKYIHVGGDEPHSTKREDYIYCMSRTQDIVNSQGKIMMGWNEIADIELRPNSIVQFWDKQDKAKKEALEAVHQGVKIVMSPADRTYMDMKYDSTTAQGKAWAGFIEIRTAYDWDMETYLPGLNKEDMLGIECALWTDWEKLSVTKEEMEYMYLPRLLGYAEIGWTPANLRNWDDYKNRLAHHGLIFKENGVNFYASKQINWK